MKSFPEYIDAALAACPANETTAAFKLQVNKRMEERARQLKKRGLDDEAVLYDLVVSENADLKREYDAFEARRRELRKRKRIPLISLLYLLGLVAVYLTAGALWHFWHPGWLIVEGGVTVLLIGILLFTVTRLNLKRWYPVSRILIALCVMLAAQFLFLLLRIPFRYERSYLVFIGAPAVLLICDAVLGTLTRQELIVINYLLYIPGVAALGYVILGLLGAVPWHPGWLIMIAAVLVDVAVLTGTVLYNRRFIYHPEVSDEWDGD